MCKRLIRLTALVVLIVTIVPMLGYGVQASTAGLDVSSSSVQPAKKSLGGAISDAVRDVLQAVVDLVVAVVDAIVDLFTSGGQSGGGTNQTNSNTTTNTTVPPKVQCNHEWTFQETREATCAEEGKDIYICTKCKELKEEIKEQKKPHTPVQNAAEEYLAVEANCQGPAQYYESCSVCGAPLTATFEKGNKGTHVFELTQEASCMNDGRNKYQCKYCGKEKAEYVGKKHKYQDSYENRGELVGHRRTQTCELCGHTVVDNKTVKHSYSNGVCVCGAIEVTSRPPIVIGEEDRVRNDDTQTVIGISHGENQSEDLPVTVYFGGAGAINNLDGSVNNVNNRKIYDATNGDLIIPTCNATPKNGDRGREEAAAQAFLEYYSSSEYKDRPIYLDGHSNGGYGAMYVAAHAEEYGIDVKQLVLADANYNTQELRDFVQNNPDTTVYNTSVSGSTTTSSGNCRSRDLMDCPNYNGQLVYAGHVNALPETLRQTGAVDERIADERNAQ